MDRRSPAWRRGGRQLSGPPAEEQPGPPPGRSAPPLEGVLKKYTNLLQGWQSRYFVLDPEIGQLQYYLNGRNRSQRPPRGSLPLLGAKVVSSRDHPFMFTIQSTAGDSYKIRALDAQEQELWMTQLQLCSQQHCHKGVCPAEGLQKNEPNSTECPPHQDVPLSCLDQDRLILKTTSSATLSCLGECLSMFQHNVVQALNQNQNQNHVPSPFLCQSPGVLNSAPPPRQVRLWSQHFSLTGRQVEPGGLRTSNASSTHSLREIARHSRDGGGPGSGTPFTGNSIRWSRLPSENMADNEANKALSSSALASCTQVLKDLEPHSEPLQLYGPSSSRETQDPHQETTDTEDNEEEEDLGVLEDQRNIILHLLSQLKQGMDLTRVVLPTFILEKRSLLEMYANFMAHPDMFLSITSGCTPEERIIRFVEYYLTAFHEGRKGAVAKKPYNPILGESFHCSWYVPRDCVHPLRTTSSSSPNSAPITSPSIVGSLQNGTNSDCNRRSDGYHVHFVAEQVSHHPPVSGFYWECKEKRMCVNTHIWTKSKFMGMSVGVSMVGEGVLYLLEHDEEYVFTLPCAYARSILTVPWVELGGKVTINCAKSGYSATVTFHTKPFYGGKVHRVTAEVKHNQTANTVCKAQGEWNGMLEFSYSNGEHKVIDTSKLPVVRKRLRPLQMQDQYESRRLWQHVTASLKEGNMDAATEHKRFLEERQRSEGKERAAKNTSWKPKYFNKEGEGWVYHDPLWKTD